MKHLKISQTQAGLLLTIVTRGIAVMGGVALSLVVARALGPDGLGQFTIYLTILSVAALVGRRGLDLVLIREVAKHSDVSQQRHAYQLLLEAFWESRVSIALVGIVALLFLYSGIVGDYTTADYLLFTLVLPAFAGVSLYAGYLKGLNKSWLAALIEIGGASGVTAVILVLGYGATKTFSVTAIIAAFTIVQVGILGLMAVGHTRQQISRSTPVLDQTGAFYFMTNAVSVFLTQAGAFLLIAPFVSEAAIGMLRAVERLGLLVSFSSLAVNPFIAPLAVKKYRTGDIVAFRTFLYKVLIVSGGLALLPFAILIFFQAEALSFFGEEFKAALPYLPPMLIGNFVFAVLAPCTMISSMCNREKAVSFYSLISLCLAIPLYPLASYWFGAWGFVWTYIAITLMRALSIAVVTFRNMPSADTN